MFINRIIVTWLIFGLVASPTASFANYPSVSGGFAQYVQQSTESIQTNVHTQQFFVSELAPFGDISNRQETEVLAVLAENQLFKYYVDAPCSQNIDYVAIPVGFYAIGVNSTNCRIIRFDTGSLKLEENSGLDKNAAVRIFLEKEEPKYVPRKSATTGIRVSDLPEPFRNALQKLANENIELFDLVELLSTEIGNQFKLVDESFAPDHQKSIALNKITANHWAHLMSMVLSEFYGFPNRLILTQPAKCELVVTCRPVHSLDLTLQILKDGEWVDVQNRLSRNFGGYQDAAEESSTTWRRTSLAIGTIFTGILGLLKKGGALPPPPLPSQTALTQTAMPSTFGASLVEKLNSWIPDLNPLNYLASLASSLSSIFSGPGSITPASLGNRVTKTIFGSGTSTWNGGHENRDLTLKEIFIIAGGLGIATAIFYVAYIGIWLPVVSWTKNALPTQSLKIELIKNGSKFVDELKKVEAALPIEERNYLPISQQIQRLVEQNVPEGLKGKVLDLILRADAGFIIKRLRELNIPEGSNAKLSDRFLQAEVNFIMKRLLSLEDRPITNSDFSFLDSWTNRREVDRARHELRSYLNLSLIKKLSEAQLNGDDVGSSVDEIRKLESILFDRALLTSCTKRVRDRIRGLIFKLPMPLWPALTKYQKNGLGLDRDELCRMAELLVKNTTLLALLSVSEVNSSNHDILPQTIADEASGTEGWQRSLEPPFQNYFSRYTRPSDLTRLHLGNPLQSVEQNIAQGTAFTISDREKIDNSDNDEAKENHKNSHLLIAFHLSESEQNLCLTVPLVRLIAETLEEQRSASIGVILFSSSSFYYFQFDHNNIAQTSLDLINHVGKWESENLSLRGRLLKHLLFASLFGSHQLKNLFDLQEHTALFQPLRNSNVKLLYFASSKNIPTGEKEIWMFSQKLRQKYELSSFEITLKQMVPVCPLESGEFIDEITFDSDRYKQLEPNIKNQKIRVSKAIQACFKTLSSSNTFDTVSRFFAGDLSVLSDMTPGELVMFAALAEFFVGLNSTHYNPEMAAAVMEYWLRSQPLADISSAGPSAHSCRGTEPDSVVCESL